jgi:hypothetical protein
MNSRGQFWSLDVVLAAAIFTLALGLVISSSELSVFYGQQERNTQELLSAALLTSNNFASRSDMWLQYVPPACDFFQGGNPDMCKDSTCVGQACSANVLDLTYAIANIRCGPNFDFYLDKPVCTTPPCDISPPTVLRKPRGWVSDNELSSLENCMIDFVSAFRTIQSGLSPEYNIDVNAHLSDGNYTHFYTAKVQGTPHVTLSRKMIIFPFPQTPDANDLRTCLDGGCANYLTDLNIRVWRN